MARKIIRIDTYIGRWGYGKELLRFDLDGTQQDGALLQISSFGGDVFHALDMYNQIAAHGNVEAVFTGPSASAATILAMAAKKVSIVDNCFLLVHKVMAGVESFGLFNEDELDALIRDLKVLKKENQQFDKAIAHIYSKRTGRSHEEMIRQMKANTWMNAQQALESGFVDQVTEPSEKVNVFSGRLVAMALDSGLPPLPGDFSPASGFIEKPTIENMNDTNTDQFPLICKTIETGSLESSEEGSYLNPLQLEAIEGRLSDLEQQASGLSRIREELAAVRSSLETVTAERDTAAAERDAARELLHSNAEIHQAVAGELQELTGAVDSLDLTVAAAGSSLAKAEAIRLLLARKPGAGALGILDRKDRDPKTEGVDWELINHLPHNLELDKNL